MAKNNNVKKKRADKGNMNADSGENTGHNARKEGMGPNTNR